MNFSQNSLSTGGLGTLPRPAPAPPSRLCNSPRTWPPPPSQAIRRPSEAAIEIQNLPHQRGWRFKNYPPTMTVTTRQREVLAQRTRIDLPRVARKFARNLGHHSKTTGYQQRSQKHPRRFWQRARWFQPTKGTFHSGPQAWPCGDRRGGGATHTETPLNNGNMETLLIQPTSQSSPLVEAPSDPDLPPTRPHEDTNRLSHGCPWHDLWCLPGLGAPKSWNTSRWWYWRGW